jgi:hypothetical protein
VVFRNAAGGEGGMEDCGTGSVGRKPPYPPDFCALCHESHSNLTRIFLIPSFRVHWDSFFFGPSSAWTLTFLWGGRFNLLPWGTF